VDDDKTFHQCGMYLGLLNQALVLEVASECELRQAWVSIVFSKDSHLYSL
jgi:hypothetical protein